MKKVYIYKVMDNSGPEPKATATIWWTGRKIESDNPLLLKQLKGVAIMGKTINDGLDFFNTLPFHFRNGYISLKRVK